MDVDEILRSGIEAAKAGNLQLASDLLAQVVKADPNREQAWLWLARARTDPQEKEYCYQRVLSLNPLNLDARRERQQRSEPNSIPTPAQVPAAPTPQSQTEDAVPKSETGAGQRRQKILAAFAGLAVGLLLCGAPLLYLVATGKFERAADPLAQAIQTSNVALVASGTPSPTNSPTVTATIPLTFEERFKQADPFITEAFNAMTQGSYPEAVQAWNQVIQIVPEWPEGYYLRGTVYMSLLNDQRSLEEYTTYLQRAGEDFDKAIALDPVMDGNYFVDRALYYERLATLQESRANYLPLEQIAYDNLVIAGQVGNPQKLSNRSLIFYLINLGRCAEAMVEADRQLAEATPPSSTINTGIALAYFCEGKTKNALTYIDKAISIKETCPFNFAKARILYVMKRYADAIGVLNKTFEVCPYYFGERYYLRGLIYADQGELEKAQTDLAFGSGQTWSHGGLLPYALGKIALANGDSGSALTYFQAAEDSYLDQDPILDMMRADIEKLGGSPLEGISSVPPVTAIPTPTIMATPRPISTLATPPLTPEVDLSVMSSVDIEKSLGPILVNPNSYYLWRFQPATAIPHRNIQTLSVWILSSDTAQPLPGQIFVWDFTHNIWGAITQPKWGQNDVDFPDDRVSRDGDVVIFIQGSSEVLNTKIDQLGVRLTVEKDDGSIALVGFTP